MSYKYAIKWSTEKMIAKSYADYCAKKAQQWGILMEINNQMMEEATESLEYDPGTEYFTAILTNKGINIESTISLNHGSITVVNLVQQMFWSYYQYTHDFSNYGITVSTIEGSEYKYSLEEFNQELQATYHAIQTENGVASGYMNGNDVTSIISNIRDHMASLFNSGYTDYSSYLNEAINKVKSGYSIVEYIDKVYEDSGNDDIINDQSTGYDNGSSYTYSGVTPVSAMNFSNVFSAYASGIKVAAQATKTVIKGLVNLGKKLFKKAKDKLIQVTADPYDIEVMDKNADTYTVDGFFHQVEQTFSRSSVSNAVLESLSKAPIHYDLVPCEVLVELKNITDTNFTVFINLKIKPVRWSLIKQIVEDTSEYGHSDIVTVYSNNAAYGQGSNAVYKTLILPYPDKFCAWISEQIDSANSMYYDVDVSEVELFKGFCAGLFLTNTMLRFLSMEGKGSDLDSMWNIIPATCLCLQEDYDFVNSITSVSNRDFVELLASNPSMDTVTDHTAPQSVKKLVWRYIHANLPSTTGIINADKLPALSLAMLNGIFNQQILQPFNYEFWPYQQNNSGFFDSRFTVKTDQQNALAFEKFLTGAILVVGVVILAVTTGIVLRKIASKAFANYQGALMNMTKEAAEGKVSAETMRKFRKAKRLNNLFNMSSNTLNMPSTIGSGDVTDVSLIISLIK